MARLGRLCARGKLQRGRAPLRLAIIKLTLCPNAGNADTPLA